MKRIVHVKAKRIVSHDGVGKPVINESVIKLIDQPEFLSLENRSPFAKFVKYMNMNKYMENPKILEVIDFDTRKPLDVEEYQKAIDEMAAKSKSKEKIDYKKLAQEKELELKRMKDDFEQRLKALEKPVKKVTEKVIEKPVEVVIKKTDREILKAKATELNIKFKGNIGNAKLLEKIQAIEPEFKIE